MSVSQELKRAGDTGDDRAFRDIVERRRQGRMAMVDAFTPELRKLVHEYGLSVVKTLLDVGVRKPNQIRHVVETILDEFSPTRGATGSQGVRRADGISANHPLNR